MEKLSDTDLINKYAEHIEQYLTTDNPNDDGSYIHESFNELLSRLSKGKRAIELIKECNDYLNSLYGENSICSGSILHKKMKDYE